jgi:hypothetical protein
MSDVCEKCGYDWVERDAWERHLEQERRKAIEFMIGYLNQEDRDEIPYSEFEEALKAYEQKRESDRS